MKKQPLHRQLLRFLTDLWNVKPPEVQQKSWENALEFASQFIPEPEWEISRQLFCYLLLLSDGEIRFDRLGMADETLLLILENAWLGYTNAAALVQSYRDHDASKICPQSIVSCLEDLALVENHFFLPIVFRIKSRLISCRRDKMKVDTILEEFGHLSIVGPLKAVFGEANWSRTNSLILLGLLSKGWEQNDLQTTPEELYYGTLRHLRYLYEAPEDATYSLCAHALAFPIAARISEMVNEVSSVSAGALWLEALFAIEVQRSPRYGLDAMNGPC
jgi:hypothetical protein